MGLIWLEAVLPLGIIAGMLCVMGNAQYFIHKAAHGGPKHIGNDSLHLLISHYLYISALEDCIQALARNKIIFKVLSLWTCLRTRNSQLVILLCHV
ncbi:NADH dehydrogenase [ubiquinone] 1 alpha subcomplex subunit 1 [Olea europaea subsp. europaea]|uniref:NADH dehydrogenase [ubiquinone] 1 alpha subcomplex subunit 1 n=1 Tax=Olea europaea subsp. europaea TaxID=158383 RepID=A0A8S0Q1U0_OLEEU|nr:NADH dehydrogenase [ubiquinone] 1 alpha subcomplex subunit 1 [Olea europaea subsp. europaea]